MLPKTKVYLYKWICYGAFMFLCALLQTTLLSGIRILYCSPSLIPFIVAAIALREGVEEGMLAGLIGGIICDGMYSGYEAFYTVSLTVLAFAVCILNTVMYWKNYGMAILDWIILLLPLHFFHYCIYMLLQGTGEISSLLYVIPGEVAATLPFTPFVYIIITRIAGRFEGAEDI